ncbi:hypothetical protein NTGBS_750006 [Candidatus Nitrotoga sp. BS]|nr:hypothetical protein NTGBS_750006 [Candidatus Nitrotoga sp. BS]
MSYGDVVEKGRIHFAACIMTGLSQPLHGIGVRLVAGHWGQFQHYNILFEC